MSLDAKPEQTLEQLKGMLETIQAAYLIEFDPVRRRQLNEEFKSLASQIVSRFGNQGRLVVDSITRQNMKLLRQ